MEQVEENSVAVGAEKQTDQRERRGYQRFDCDLVALVTASSGEVFACRCADLSRGGACLVGSVDVDRKVRLGITLRVMTPSVSDDLRLTGRVAWCSQTRDGDYQIGMAFDALPDEATFRRLEILLELLSGRLQLPTN